MGVPLSIETRNKIHACMARRWNETKKKTVLRISLGRDRGRSRCLVALSKRSKLALISRSVSGYDYIALGGMVPLKSNEILACLKAVNEVKRATTKIHLLGVTRAEHVTRFCNLGVVNFDSTSPLRQAFKGEKDNYYMMDRTYRAIRVPQLDGNPKLRQLIASGKVGQKQAIGLERECLDRLIAYGEHKCNLDETLEAIQAYETLNEGRSPRGSSYQEVLRDRPWEECPCEICRRLGVHVVLFRGAERNRRRGFHNLHVFHRRLRRESKGTTAGETKVGSR